MITPNMITSIRIGLVPLLIFSYLYMPKYGEKIAFFVLVFSAITDIFDGYIARKNNMITKLGTVLDPLADKIMIISVMGIFVIKNKTSFWIFIVVVLKELLMILGAYLIYNCDDIVVPANIYGKLTTLMFYLSVFCIILRIALSEIFLNIFAALNILSLFIYFYNYISVKKII